MPSLGQSRWGSGESRDPGQVLKCAFPQMFRAVIAFFKPVVEVLEELKSCKPATQVGILPDVKLSRRQSWPGDSFATRPMVMSKTVALMNATLEQCESLAPGLRFNSLRRAFPTLGNCLEIDAEEAQRLSN